MDNSNDSNRLDSFRSATSGLQDDFLQNIRSEYVLSMRRNMRETENTERRLAAAKYQLNNFKKLEMSDIRNLLNNNEKTSESEPDDTVKTFEYELQSSRVMLLEMGTKPISIRDFKSLERCVDELKVLIIMNDKPESLNLVIDHDIPQLLANIAKSLYEQYLSPMAMTTLMPAEKTKINDILFIIMWSFTNLAAGETNHVEAIVKTDIYSVVSDLIEHTSDIKLFEQLVWLLGNIAGDIVKYKLAISSRGFIKQILVKMASFIYSSGHPLNLDSNSPASSLIVTALWSLSNFCRRPSLSLEEIMPIVDEAKLWVGCNNPNIVKDALWVLAFSLDTHRSIADNLVESNLVPIFLNIMGRINNHRPCMLPSLRIIGNIITGEDKHVNTVIRHDGISRLLKFVKYSPPGTLNEDSMWALSNIAVGPTAHIQLLLDTDILAMAIKYVNSKKATERLKLESAWLLTNLITYKESTPELRARICDKDYIDGLINAMTNIADNKIQSVVLNSFSILLDDGERQVAGGFSLKNQYKEHLLAANAVAILEELLENLGIQSKNLSAQVITILEKLSEYDYITSKNIEPTTNDTSYLLQNVTIQQSMLNVPEAGYDLS